MVRVSIQSESCVLSLTFSWAVPRPHVCCRPVLHVLPRAVVQGNVSHGGRHVLPGAVLSGIHHVLVLHFEMDSVCQDTGGVKP